MLGMRSYDRALVIASSDADTWASKGNVLGELNRSEPIQAYDRALAINSNDD